MNTKRLIVPFLLLLAVACATAPPVLTPQANQAWQNTRVIKGLDLLRDTAIDANAQQPPLISTDVTRKIVTWHQSALRIIQASGSGWASAVRTSLNELTAALPVEDRARLAPYLSLIQSLLNEVA